MRKTKNYLSELPQIIVFLLLTHFIKSFEFRLYNFIEIVKWRMLLLTIVLSLHLSVTN